MAVMTALLGKYEKAAVVQQSAAQAVAEVPAPAVAVPADVDQRR